MADLVSAVPDGVTLFSRKSIAYPLRLAVVGQHLFMSSSHCLRPLSTWWLKVRPQMRVGRRNERGGIAWYGGGVGPREKAVRQPGTRLAARCGPMLAGRERGAGPRRKDAAAGRQRVSVRSAERFAPRYSLFSQPFSSKHCQLHVAHTFLTANLKFMIRDMLCSRRLVPFSVS